ncbi:MAG: hypothetical protein HGB26_08490 [Desulfobulbaceae bacterium]|nr:hypothetical protein [Desulfobulbaceae bacterium]
MPQHKIKRKRVPHNYWPEIRTRYNATHCTNLSINALRVRACRDDVTVLEVVAEVVAEKQQEAIKDAERVEAKLRKVNMLESNAQEVI